MARVSGPLFSMDASGSIGKAITYGKWKGIAWCRVWFSPENPQTAKQVNMRTALNLAVVFFQVTLTQAQKDAYEVGAAGQGMSGYNLYMKRGLDQYIIQITVDVLPTAITSVTGNYPDDVWVWSSA